MGRGLHALPRSSSAERTTCTLLSLWALQREDHRTEETEPPGRRDRPSGPFRSSLWFMLFHHPSLESTPWVHLLRHFRPRWRASRSRSSLSCISDDTQICLYLHHPHVRAVRPAYRSQYQPSVTMPDGCPPTFYRGESSKRGEEVVVVFKNETLYVPNVCSHKSITLIVHSEP